MFQILSVEDNEGDRYLIERFFRERPGNTNICFIADGSEALDYLFRRGKHSVSPRPDLILLDLNLQRKHGKEILKEVKANHGTKNIPVFVLTTSRSLEDRKGCLSLGAEDFFSKPFSVDELNKTLEYVVSWLEKKTTSP